MLPEVVVGVEALVRLVDLQQLFRLRGERVENLLSVLLAVDQEIAAQPGHQRGHGDTAAMVLRPEVEETEPPVVSRHRWSSRVAASVGSRPRFSAPRSRKVGPDTTFNSAKVLQLPVWCIHAPLEQISGLVGFAIDQLVPKASDEVRLVDVLVPMLS